MEIQLRPGDILAIYPDSIVRIDPVAGDPQIVLSAGSGRSFADLAIGPNGDLFMTDCDGEVLRLDLETGLVSTVAEGLSFSCIEPFGLISGEIAVELDGSLLVISGFELLRIDPVTGEQSVLATSKGVPLLFADVAIDAGGDIFLVYYGGSGIYRVDPEASDLTLAFEVDLDNPYGSRLIISTTGDFFVNSGSAILRLDPHTGAQETYAYSGLTGFGDIAEQPDGSLLAVEVSQSCPRRGGFGICTLVGSQIARVPSGDFIPNTPVSHHTRSIAVVRPACTDQLDNDGDGLIDLDDPDCTSSTGPLEAPDADGDLVEDGLDNCVQVSNPRQGDTDCDDYGNACDCDFNQSLTCDIPDFNVLLSDFASGTDSGVGTDMDADGSVEIGDFSLFLPCFAAGVPGPSGPVRQSR
jgi:streptogramin lyase